MSDKVDLDIDNWDVEDIIYLFNLNEIMPLSNVKKNLERKKEIIKERVEEYKKSDKFKGKKRYLEFLESAKQKLLSIISENERIDVYNENIQLDDSNASKVFKTQYLERNLSRDQHAKLLDFQKNVIENKKVSNSEQFNVPELSVTQGNNNPLLRRVTNQIINFDSQYRGTFNEKSCYCNIGCFNEQATDLGSNIITTDFVVNLSEPVRNVMSMKLHSCEFPTSWYVFSGDYGTNSFTISGESVKDIIEIDEGNYTSDGLITEINNKINDSSFNLSDISFSYMPNQKKVKITTTENLTLIFFNDKISECDNNFGAGQKLNYNLGWLLGFRRKEIIINGSAIGLSPIDLLGTKYLLLSVDDFNNNKPNSSLVSSMDNRNVFKLPRYYNPVTMCNDLNYGWKDYNDCSNTNTRGCSSIPVIKKENICSLTRAQIYTINELKSTNNENSGSKFYLSPNSNDILAKIPLNGLDMAESIKNISYSEHSSSINRQYYGPITLRKLRCRLLNDKGYVINLNNRDWSFSISVRKLYQF